MGWLVRFAITALRSLPTPLNSAIRAGVPVVLKRRLRSAVMASIPDDDTIRVRDGRLFAAIPEGVFARILYEGGYEPDLTEAVIHLVHPGDALVDVGANFGWYTTLFARVSTQTKTVAYEPSEWARAVLEKNLRLNGLESRVDLRKAAVGSRAGSAWLAPAPSGLGGLEHLTRPGAPEAVEVPMVRLDEDLHEMRRSIAFIKMDVEGSELDALEGAAGLLDCEHQPILQLEVNDEALRRAGSSRIALLSYLRKAGYTFLVPAPFGRLRRTAGREAANLLCAGTGRFGDRIRARSN